MGDNIPVRLAAVAIYLLANGAFASDAVSRKEAISIAKDYVQGLHIGDVDCMRILAHRRTTPPKEASESARQKLALSPFWIVTLKPLEKNCAPAQIVYVMTDTGKVWYARDAR